MQDPLQQYLKTVSHLHALLPEQSQAALLSIRSYLSSIADLQVKGFALYKLAEHIMRLSAVPQTIRPLLEDCVSEIIAHATESDFKVGHEALRCIFDTNNEYYKHSQLDLTGRQPLGLDYPLQWYEPEVGESVDVVKPYITSTGFCGWTRGVLVAKQDGKYTVAYDNSDVPVTVASIPFFAPLGTRTADHLWRDNLKEGDLVDAYNNKYWYPGTVIGLGIFNGSRRVKIAYRRYDNSGSLFDQQGNGYEGLSSTEDDWIDIFSSRIQKPGKMAKKLCYYSTNCEEIVVEDNYDIIFEKEFEQKPFWGIMRSNFTRSLSFLRFFDWFCEKGAFQRFLSQIEKKQITLQTWADLLVVFGNTAWAIPRMGLHRFHKQLLNESLAFAKQNNKLLNPQRLDILSYFVDAVGKRLYSISEKHVILNDLRKYFSLEYFKLNLEKQMIALRFLVELVRPIRPYQNQAEKEELLRFLKDNQIYYKVIQANVHEQILSRSVDLLKFMLEKEIIGWTQIDHLWNLMPHTDLRGRATIEKLIGDISKQFRFDFTFKIIDRILAVKESDLTIDKLNLLRTLKDRDLTFDYKSKILNFLWECLTVRSANIKHQVEEEVEKVFRGFINSIKQNELKLEALKSISGRLKEIASIKNEMSLFREFILTYPIYPNQITEGNDKNAEVIVEDKPGVPRTVSEVVDYLKKEKIYDSLLRLLALVKGKEKEKIESILKFVSFLFEKDKGDISEIVKAIYELQGPSDQFLHWAKNLASRAVKFFAELFENTTKMQKFENISHSGFQSIKNIILDINIHNGNIKILKKRKIISGSVSTVPLPGPLLPNQIDPPAKMPDKQEILTFIYVLRSPFECLGLTFLLKLVQITKEVRIYDDLVKMIIQFFVNLDDRILNQAKQFRQEFLKKIIEDINSIVKKGVFDENIKKTLTVYLNLAEQLFFETEKDGMGNMRPHFSTIDGEIIKLKIQNHITNSDIYKKEPYLIDCSENMTLWDLKVKLAPVFNQPVDKIDLVKYVDPIPDSQNGRSIQDLHFFNEQVIKIKSKQAKDLPKVDLLTDGNEALVDRFNKIVESWFSCYKNQNGYLTIDELTLLANNHWKGSVFKQAAKLKEMIINFDKIEKGGLDLNELKQFFIVKSINSNHAIWRILNLEGYRNDLKHKDELVSVVLDESNCSRRIFSKPEVYETIFQLLSCEAFQPVHINFYKFLTLLETDTNLSTILKSNIKEFLQTETCIYRLSYGLETLINSLENDLELYCEFYQHSGHEAILNKLHVLFLQDKDVYSLDALTKTVVIPNLLKILNLYVYPQISDNKSSRFIKRNKINHLELEQIFLKYDRVENEAGEQKEKRERLAGLDKKIDIEAVFKLSEKILQNAVKNYKSDFLIKLTFEISRLYGSLALINPLFDPLSLVQGIKSESANLRRVCQNLIYIYLVEHPSFSTTLLDNLIANLPKENTFVCGYYFTLLMFVLQKTIDLMKESQQFDLKLKQIALELVNLIWKQSNEGRLYSLNGTNRILVGVLAFFLLIISKKPQIAKELQYLKEDFITKCLFFYSVEEKLEKVQIAPELLTIHTQPELFEDYVKCKSEDTRKVLMEIIYHLYKESNQDKSQFFEKFILPILNQLPESTKKTSTKTVNVGLTNPGSICYMNSMLQVLNTIQPLKNALISADLQASIIQELRQLFSFLYFSERMDYSPHKLLSSFVPPINPSLQQDTTEFLNFLFDQLEQALKGSPYKKLLEELFKGKQVAQMICHGCGAKRERQQPFFTFGVEIEGKYDLQSALEGMQAGQLITDCLCETCNQRCDTTKRNVLSEVPNIFFVHLKRIVFNYDVFMNTKIHTRLHFPLELDYQPYTREGIQLRERVGLQYLKSLKDNEQEAKKFNLETLHGKNRQDYQLKLKGIIIHSGTPDLGHYYSIIRRETVANKDSKEVGKEAKDNKTEKKKEQVYTGWVKYDDSRVTYTGTTAFDEECYGGECIADPWGGPGSSKNAYVLVYEKLSKRPIDIIQPNNPNEIKQIPYEQFNVYNTVDAYKQVWVDNHKLMLELQLTGESQSKAFLNFISKMLELTTDSTAKIQTISQIFFKISTLSGELGTLPDFFIKNSEFITPSIFYRYLIQQKKKIFSILFHQQQKIRDFASVFIEKVLITCYRTGQELLQLQIKEFIQEYLNHLHGEAAKNWMRIDGYFRLFHLLVESSIAFSLMPLYKLLVEADLITLFIDFVLERASPLTLVAKKYSLGNKHNPVSFHAAIDLILTLYKRSFGLNGMNYELPHPNHTTLFHLSDYAITCLTSPVFHEKLLKQNQNPGATAELLHRLCIRNEAFSLSISRTILKCLNSNTELSDDLEGLLLTAMKILTIRDEFWTLRAESLLGHSMPFVFQANLMESCEEDRYIYPSGLDNSFPLQSLLSYASINKIRCPLRCLIVIKTILEGSSVSEEAKLYLLSQPAPNYCQLRYVDWLKPYLEQLPGLVSLNQKKKEDVAAKIQQCLLYLADLHGEAENMDFVTLITGQVGKKELKGTLKDERHWVEVNLYYLPAYVVRSQPTGISNVAFGNVLTSCKLEKKVTGDSEILKFFKVAKKQVEKVNVVENEEKELMSLFDEDPYPTVTVTAPPAPAVEEIKKEEVVIVPTEDTDKKQEKKVQEAVVIDVDGAYEDDEYVGFLQILNKTATARMVKLSFNSACPRNATLPHLLSMQISKTKEQYWFTKINPNEPGLSLDHLHLLVEQYIQPDKRIITRHYPNPFQQQQAAKKEEVVEQEKEEQKEDEKDEGEGQGEKGEGNNGDGFEAYDGISCPICTYLNPTGEVNCEVCGSSLFD